MNRRGFFGAIVAAAVVPIVAKVEPYLPKPLRERANRLLSTERIQREMLRVLRDQPLLWASSDDPVLRHRTTGTIRFRRPKQWTS